MKELDDIIKKIKLRKFHKPWTAKENELLELICNRSQENEIPTSVVIRQCVHMFPGRSHESVRQHSTLISAKLKKN